jgi:hypothetical protein
VTDLVAVFAGYLIPGEGDGVVGVEYGRLRPPADARPGPNGGLANTNYHRRRSRMKSIENRVERSTGPSRGMSSRSRSTNGKMTGTHAVPSTSVYEPTKTPNKYYANRGYAIPF